jgi:hypothetical protein
MAPAVRSNSNPGRAGRGGAGRGGRGSRGGGGLGKPGVSGNIPVPTRDGPAGNGPAGAGSTSGDRRDGGGVIHGDGPGGFLDTLCHPFGKGPDTGGDSYCLPAMCYRPKG